MVWKRSPKGVFRRVSSLFSRIHDSIMDKNRHTYILSVCELKAAADAPNIPELLELPVPPQKGNTEATGSGRIPLRFIRTVWEHFEQGLSRPVTPVSVESSHETVPFLTWLKIRPWYYLFSEVWVWHDSFRFIIYKQELNVAPPRLLPFLKSQLRSRKFWRANSSKVQKKYPGDWFLWMYLIAIPCPQFLNRNSIPIADWTSQGNYMDFFSPSTRRVRVRSILERFKLAHKVQV